MDDLDQYEQEVEQAIARGDYTENDEIEEALIAQEAADNYLRKSERISIRLTPFDLSNIKGIAAEEGIPYQTLVSSVLHKYVTGKLVDTNYINTLYNSDDRPNA